MAARDAGALVEVYERSHRAVYTLVLRMTQSAATAEQLTAEVYRAVYRAAPRWPNGDRLVLTRILGRARSLALRHMRRERREHQAAHHGEPGRFAFDMPHYRDLLEMRSLESRLRAARATLDGDALRLVDAVYFGGRTYREAAAALDRPPAAVRGALHRAFVDLAEGLGLDLRARGRTCPRADAACALAVGALPADELDEVSAHVDACSACTGSVAVMGRVLGALVAWPTDLLRPRAPLRSRVLAGLGEPAPSPVEPGPTFRSVSPEISYSLLAVDPDTRRVGMLVRLTPGGVYPAHVHAGEEELFLLAGELWIEDRLLHPGDYNHAGAGSRDVRVKSETGCTCVLLTSADDALGAT